MLLQLVIGLVPAYMIFRLLRWRFGGLYLPTYPDRVYHTWAALCGILVQLGTDGTVTRYTVVSKLPQLVLTSIVAQVIVASLIWLRQLRQRRNEPTDGGR